MTYEGTVQNGVVVLAGGQTLPEGTVVQVLPQATTPMCAVADPAQAPGEATIGEKLAALGRWAESQPCDLPVDLAENHDHYLHGLPKRQ
jgi:hypothetical protein